MTLIITHKHPVTDRTTRIDLETAFDMALDEPRHSDGGALGDAQNKADNTARALGRLVEHLMSMKLISPSEAFIVAGQPHGQSWSDQ